MARIVIFTAVAAVCIAVIVSALLSRNRKNAAANMPVLERPSMPRREKSSASPFTSQNSKSAGNTKPSKSSWANSLLPFYSLGILAYVVFIVGKIMTRQFSGSRRDTARRCAAQSSSWVQRRPNKGNSKTKITMHEIRQLEDKLMETEEVVQQILANASKTLEMAGSSVEKRHESSEEEILHELHKRTRVSDDIPTKSPLFEEHGYSEDDEREVESNLPRLRKRRVVESGINSKRSEDEFLPDDDFEIDYLKKRKAKQSSRKNYEERRERRIYGKQSDDEDSLSDEELPCGKEFGKYKAVLPGRNFAGISEAAHHSGHSKETDSLSENRRLLAATKNIQETMLNIKSYIHGKKMHPDEIES